MLVIMNLERETGAMQIPDSEGVRSTGWEVGYFVRSPTTHAIWLAPGSLIASRRQNRASTYRELKALQRNLFTFK